MEHALNMVRIANFKEVENRGIVAGVDSSGKKVFVGGTYDRFGNFSIAKIVPELEKSFFAFNDVEEIGDQIEILENPNDFEWIKSDGRILQNAAAVKGHYIGRANYNGNIVVGRIDANKKELIATFEGKTFSLPSYDILAYKFANGVVHEKYQKAEYQKAEYQKIEYQKAEYQKGEYQKGEYQKSEYNVRHEEINVTNYINKIRALEFQNAAYLKEKQSFEQRLEFEQKKVSELSNQVKKVKIENARYVRERESFEGKFILEQQKASQNDIKLREYALNNSYLIKKLNSLEEAIRNEKLLVESVTEKLQSTMMYEKKITTRITNFEQTIKTQQERIFELESEIMISSSSSESMLKRISDYESTIKSLRLQIEVVEKKLQISCQDNDYLIERMSMLTKNLRIYQMEVENLSVKLQSSKTVIASAHVELSRVNAQVSKYQAALSSCYSLNGDLMTKVSGLNSVVQHQSGADSSYHLINYTSDFGYTSKSSVYNKTSSLIEVSTSDFEKVEAQVNGVNGGP